MGCSQWNRLQPIVFEALQLLKSAYRNGHISAMTQAGFHTESYIASLDDNSEDLDT
jgi:hypothetical protein